MKKYYEAYEDRYKTVHNEKGLAWAGETPSFVLKDWLIKYNINEHNKILEIGCGEGQNARFLQKENFNVLASDISPEAIRWCKQKAKQENIDENKYFILDIVDNNLQDKYDCIYSISTIHMLVVDSDRKAFWDFIYNHLNDDGIAIVTSMGNGEFERHNSDITKAFDLDEREFNNEKIKVATTTCRIVNWEGILKEIDNSNLQVLEKFISEDIAGFNQSMITILKRK